MFSLNFRLTNLTVDLLLSNTESVSLNRKVLNLLSESILLQVWIFIVLLKQIKLHYVIFIPATSGL